MEVQEKEFEASLDPSYKEKDTRVSEVKKDSAGINKGFLFSLISTIAISAFQFGKHTT
jgi:hypothetical protein